MHIDWALPALHASLTEAGTIHIVDGAVDTMLVPEHLLPSQVEIVVAGRIVAPMEEWLEPGHELRIDVINSADARLSRHRQILRQLAPPPLLQPYSTPGRLVALPQRWRVTAPDMFTVRLFLDDELQHAFDLLVVTAGEAS